MSPVGTVGSSNRAKILQLAKAIQRAAPDPEEWPWSRCWNRARQVLEGAENADWVLEAIRCGNE